MADVDGVLEKALSLDPPVSLGQEVKNWGALIDLVNAVPAIRSRLTLLEEALKVISKMKGCEIEAASEFAKAVLETDMTYQEWLVELRSGSQKKPSA